MRTGLNAKLLNARPENVERESEIIAQAGRRGAITVATNMAGRGTDILLGGSAKGLSKVLTKYMMLYKLGSYKLAGNEAEENRLRNLGDSNIEENASDQAIVENDPDVIALPSLLSIATSLDLWLPAVPSTHIEIDVKRAVISCIDKIGEKAGKVEVEDIISQAADGISSSATDYEVKLLRSALNKLSKEFDEVIKAERDVVKKLGGLYVIGTSRHESRRIDNQLRGRSGRQGDPGSSRFFLSLEDDLFRIFGADKMAGKF